MVAVPAGAKLATPAPIAFHSGWRRVLSEIQVFQTAARLRDSMEAERQLAWSGTRDLDLFYFLDGIHHRHVCAAIVLSNSSVLLGWLYRAVKKRGVPGKSSHPSLTKRRCNTEQAFISMEKVSLKLSL